MIGSSERKRTMLRRLTRTLVWSGVILCLVPLATPHTQHETKAAKKSELIEVQIKVTDKKTGSPIDNADVVIKWDEGQESRSVNANTNSSGIARFSSVPRGKVIIRVIAKGYKAVAPPIDVANEKQSIKIELDKENVDDSERTEKPLTR